MIMTIKLCAMTAPLLAGDAAISCRPKRYAFDPKKKGVLLASTPFHFNYLVTFL